MPSVIALSTSAFCSEVISIHFFCASAMFSTTCLAHSAAWLVSGALLSAVAWPPRLLLDFDLLDIMLFLSYLDEFESEGSTEPHHFLFRLASSCSRNSLRNTFPTALFGKFSANSMTEGTL